MQAFQVPPTQWIQKFWSRIECNNVVDQPHTLTALVYQIEFEKSIHSTILTYETKMKRFIFKANKTYVCSTNNVVKPLDSSGKFSQRNCSFNFVKKLFPFRKVFVFRWKQTALTPSDVSNGMNSFASIKFTELKFECVFHLRHFSALTLVYAMNCWTATVNRREKKFVKEMENRREKKIDAYLKYTHRLKSTMIRRT